MTTCEKKLKVAINGFGRIGRNFLRCWNGRESSLLDVVAINDSGGVKQVWCSPRSHQIEDEAMLIQNKTAQHYTLACSAISLRMRCP